MGNKQSSFSKSSIAQFNLGCDFYSGRNGKPYDYGQAVKYFKLAAAQGHAEAQHNLGVCYEHGRGVKKDLQEALKYYQLAAAQELARGQHNLGVCYYNGQGVRKDLQEAVKYFRLAAAQGYAWAQSNLGDCYVYGRGVKKDLHKAVKYFRLAAAQGHAQAQSNLGICYKNGLELKKDLREAVKYFRLAAVQGLAQAQSNLGVFYYNGQVVRKDLQEAVKYFRLAAVQGYAQAQSNLGVCYAHGRGVKEDLPEAVKYFRLAAAQGYAYAKEALTKLGYFEKEQIKQPVAPSKTLTAFQCNLRLANNGDVNAQYYIGNCYRTGKDVEKNIFKAFKYIKLAAQKLAIAQNTVGELYEEGIGVAKHPQLAIKFFKLAADQACVEAQYNLGRCYQYGIGKPASIVDAISYYKLAAKAGSEQASKALAIISKSSEGKSMPVSPIAASFYIPYKDLTIGEKLGEGFGGVHKGQWHHNKVAIKLLGGNSLNKASLQELQRAAQIIAKMKYDYIINLKGICIEKPNYAIVRELMPKGSLTDLLHSKDKISWKTRYGIGSDIGFGLQQLHDNNILHGSLKSMNVLITDSCRAKICDFGLSKIKNQIKSKSYVASSLAWMAAELLKTGSKNTKESDRFSYGMVLWELASRKFPYAGKEGYIRDFIASSQYLLIPENCPAAFGEIIKACWGKRAKPLTRMEPAIAAKTLANMYTPQKPFKAVPSKSPTSGYKAWPSEKKSRVVSSAFLFNRGVDPICYDAQMDDFFHRKMLGCRSTAP